MSPKFHVQMLLCDYAQVANGKVTIVGGGWNLTSQPCPSGVGGIIHLPWGQAMTTHQARLALKDQDGQPVLDTERKEIGLTFAIPQIGHPAGAPEGSPLPVPIAINCPPLPLTPGSRYVWELWIDGESDPDWQLPFSTRPQHPPLAAA